MKALLVALALLLVSGSSRAQCVGDCDLDDTVTVDEIVVMVNVALGLTPAGACAAGDADESGTITVDEILTAVSNALAGCGDNVRINGVCLRPTSGGLGACDPGTPITISRCDDLGLCPSDPGARTVLGATQTVAGGAWNVEVSASLILGATLYFEATFVPAFIYRTIDFGPAGGGFGGSGGGRVDEIAVSPISEAGVRVLDAAGLESFDRGGVEAVLQAVEAANAEVDFSNLSVRQGADVATQEAFTDPRVAAAVEAAIQTDGRLQPGADVFGDIEPRGEIDVYSFVLSEPAQIVLEASNLQESIQPCVEIATELDGAPVTGGSGCAAFTVLLELALPKGTYYVRVSDRPGENVGPYMLRLQVF